MERRNRILRSSAQALIAALMAGCCAFVAVRALGFDVGWLPAYGLAACAALLVQLGCRGPAWGLGALGLILLGSGAILLRNLSAVSAAFQALAAGGILDSAAAAAHGVAGNVLCALSAILLGGLFALLLRASSGIPFALIILLADVICTLALNESLSVWTAVPGLMAGVAAFGVPGEGRFGGVRAAVLVPAALLSLLALLFVPAQRTTWAPMEQLANRVRAVVEDYIRFTEQRVAFSINEKGYDRAGMLADSVVAMLGGPADPDDAPVMEVHTRGDLLLRGAIRRSYTGYSWVDDQAKARYLYYDFTHRAVRSDVFGIGVVEDNANFEPVQARVIMLAEGTSTLFVPAHLSRFSMNLADAVYYNSIGELFLTRKVAAGDSYEFAAVRPLDDNALMRAADAALPADSMYAQMLAEYTALPAGIDESVYALAVSLTKNDSNPAAKALAIENHLAANYRYTLNGGYPDQGRDFVSWFLNESKEGYCSYFASAMTVLCRIAGLPARYVEGYYVRDGQSIITGENAHAWTEVYLSGLGWTAFDPTARAMEQQGETAREGGDEQLPAEGHDPQFSAPPEATPSPSPTPALDDALNGDAPTPTPDPNAGDLSAEPTPSPEPGEGEQNPPSADQGDAAPPSDESSSDEENRPALLWLWLLLIALALLALIACWLRKRLRSTDPLELCMTTRSAQTAALILYRGILTLLAQAGQLPASGETPIQFAARVVKTMPNAHYEAFVADVVRSRYSGRNVTRQTIDLGRSAYIAFLQSMGRGERLRYHLRRVIHGPGSIEMIP